MITKASGIERAKAAKLTAVTALEALIRCMIVREERTIKGHVIKAQAMQACSKVDNYRRIFNIKAIDWADAMTAIIMQQTKFT